MGDVSLNVAIADTRSLRNQGLRGVEALPSSIDGMLFVFDGPTETSFTMRDTLMPLDIWWFDSEGRLIGVDVMEPCQAEPCTSYPTPGLIGWALETPAGVVALSAGAMLSTVENP